MVNKIKKFGRIWPHLYYKVDGKFLTKHMNRKKLSPVVKCKQDETPTHKVGVLWFTVRL